jgi:hypothetical protein
MRFIGSVIVRLCFVVLFAFVLAVVVMWLWNLLMPGIFGIGPIGYWQAFGLMILARLLLGTLGIHGRRWHGGPHWGHGFRHHHGWCGDMGRGEHVNDTMTWWHYYKRFWHDEGKAAFDEYLKKARKEGGDKERKRG